MTPTAATAKPIAPLTPIATTPRPVCAQCCNWKPYEYVNRRGGFCEARAEADMAQKPQDYAPDCFLYEQAVPF